MLFKYLAAFGLSQLSALAVDFGFGAAFVDNRIGYLIAAYVGALVALLFGRDGLSSCGHPAIRGLVGLVVALGTLGVLRTWALLSLPFVEFATTGHTPYFALPAVALLVTSALHAVVAAGRRSKDALSRESAAVL